MSLFEETDGFVDIFRQLFHGKRYGDLSQDETEAFVDALCYTVAADGHVADVERHQMAEAIEDVDWSGDGSLTDVIQDSLNRAEQRIERGEDPELYARNIAGRISDQDVQEDLYLFAARIAAADENLAKREQELLSELVDEFDISPETVQTVAGSILMDTDLKTSSSIPADSQSGEDHELREPDDQDRTPGSPGPGQTPSDSQSEW